MSLKFGGLGFPAERGERRGVQIQGPARSGDVQGFRESRHPPRQLFGRAWREGAVGLHAHLQALARTKRRAAPAAPAAAHTDRLHRTAGVVVREVSRPSRDETLDRIRQSKILKDV